MADQIKYLTDGAETYGADPKTGFDKLSPDTNSTDPGFVDYFDGLFDSPSKGFLTRPHGYER